MDSLGPYRDLEEIGTGGQATVYRGVHPGLERTVAIKVLHPHLSSDQAYVARFLREARLAASIDHPNVARVYDVAQDGNFHYIAMEFLPGDLRGLIDRDGRLDADRAAALGAQIAAGLAAAHRLGIIHRDVKPHNILLADDGAPKVTDFGLARAADGTALTQSGALMGTPFYMSPEQAEGRPADARSDVYSLGVVLYQMLTGNVPYTAESPMAVIRMHLDSPIPDVRVVAPTVPMALAEIVALCMAKAPEYRYQNAGEALEALNRWRSERTPSEEGPTFVGGTADGATVVGGPAATAAAGVPGPASVGGREDEPAAEASPEPAPLGAGRRSAGVLLGLFTVGLLLGAFGMFTADSNENAPPAAGVFMLGGVAFMALASYLALARRGDGGRARARSVVFIFAASLALAFVGAAISGNAEGDASGPGEAISRPGAIPAPAAVTGDPESGGEVVVARLEPAAGGQGFVARVAEVAGGDAPVNRVLFARDPRLEGATLAARELGSPAEGGAPVPTFRAVNRYVEISLDDVNGSDSVAAVLEFEVERGWLSREGLAPEDVRLYRFHNGWSMLDTEVLDADRDAVTYAAVTPGFSVFAIGAAPESVSPTTTPVPAATATATPTPAPTAVRLPTPAVAPTPTRAPAATPTPLPTSCSFLDPGTEWAGRVFSDDGSVEDDIRAVFEQTGCDLSGTFGDPANTYGPLEGAVNGDRVAFVVPGVTSDIGVDLVFEGQLEDGELSGRYEVPIIGQTGDWYLAPDGAAFEDTAGPTVLSVTVSPASAVFGDVVTVTVDAEDSSGVDYAFVNFWSPDGQAGFFCEFPDMPVSGTCTASAIAGEDSELLSAGSYIFQHVTASDFFANESLYDEYGEVSGAGPEVFSHSLGAPGFFIGEPEPPTPTPTPFRRPIPPTAPPRPFPTATPVPEVYFSAWLDLAGFEVFEVVEGTTVVLHAEGEGLDGQSLPVEVFELDLFDETLVASGEMEFVDGIGTAEWDATWMEDGSSGGDPWYVFRVLGLESSGLVVTRLTPSTPTPTATPSPTPTPTPTPTPMPTPTPRPTATPTPFPTRVPSLITVNAGGAMTGPATTSVSLSGASVSSTSAGDTFAAVIDWRDGSEPVAALVLQHNGQIIASHTYADSGTYFVRVTVQNQHNESRTDTVMALIGAAPPTPTPTATPASS